MKIAEERLLDNKLSELSADDDEKLKYELKEITTIDLSKFGIELPQIKSAAAVVGDVTPAQVQQAAQKLVGDERKVASEKKSMVEIHCPHCGEDFFADIAEVMRYAN